MSEILLRPTEVPLQGLVHLQGIGDVPFENNEFAGTRGQSRRLEGFALSITARPAGTTLRLRYMAHVQDYGDMGWVEEGTFIGTRGESLRLEGFAIELLGEAPQPGYIVNYMAHQQYTGDIGPFMEPEFCGSRRQRLRLEGMAVSIEKLGQIGIS